MAKSILEQLQETNDKAVMQLIYERVDELFGAGNQFFAMEFPLRSINSSDYAYNTDDCYSSLTKPYPVQEAEFALSDQLFDVSPIVQGSNGEKLSTVYDTALNNFVPKLDALKSFVSDQKNLREWLMSKVDVDIDGVKQSMSRIELSKKLYGDFLETRNKWYEKRDEKYDERKAADDLDGYARWLSTKGLVESDKLNNAYNDAIVRGHYHEVLTLLGFLNVSSPAEVLESTKQKMRSSVRASLDGSSDVYPVQFQPSDWFKSLKPNMSPKDLTMATDSLLADYSAKKKRLASLNASLLELGVIEISAERREQLETDIADCNDELAAAEASLIDQYGQGTVSAVRSAISIYKELNPLKNAAEITDELLKKDSGDGEEPKDTVQNIDTKSRVLDLIGDISEDVIKNIAQTYAAQSEVIKKQRRLTETLMAYSEAMVKDKQLQKLRIQEQIRAVQEDLEFLQPLVNGTIMEAGKMEEAAKAEDAPKDKGAKKDSNKESEEVTQEPLMVSSSSDKAEADFSDIIIKIAGSVSESLTQSASSASNKSTGLGGWFWSGKSVSSATSSSDQQKSREITSTLEIGFRVKKVAFNRGGWFNPTVFKLSKNYYHLTETLASGGLKKSQIYGAKNSSELEKLKQYTSTETNEQEDYILPAFPTGFLIAKDITIRVSGSSDEMALSKSYMKKQESSGGGIFCFRTNKSYSESRSSDSAYFGNSSKYFYIRIPGPQILGWFLEFTAADKSTDYESLDPEMYAVALQ